jgi:hypothetical protein
MRHNIAGSVRRIICTGGSGPYPVCDHPITLDTAIPTPTSTSNTPTKSPVSSVM